ncbi:hypothetical protein [Bacillus kwashiorkori]|uniref:hypothetical protein n=1 Tax=Bacillus kwashiorkori TaxID=1522318 RepID=UPI000780346B|nr:hypothetical protein [Bacillus kwashiorkori]
MTYIIENANLIKQNRLIKASLLVDNEKILSVQPEFAKYRYMKMNADKFYMSATDVFYQNGLPKMEPMFKEKNYFIQQFLLRGCTTILVSANVTYLHELDEKIEEVREFYQKGPLDFTIGVKIPIQIFTVPFIQKCKREKIPAIFIEFNDVRDLYKIPWGWIREALFPYNCPLIPVVHGEESVKKKLLQTWVTILQREKIPHIEHPLQEMSKLSLSVLKKIGIYPLKGYLQAGGELSYNLYIQKGDIKEKSQQSIDNLQLVITVHKGEVIRVDKKIYYNQKKGSELIIKRPSFFQ